MAGAAVVIGSLNMDLVMRVPRLPAAGETMYGHGFTLSEGGKGANQAVAIARLGASVAMVGKVGDDGFGAQLRSALHRDGVGLSHLGVSAGSPTGVAMILVDDTGENRIILAPGANHTLGPEDIDAAARLVAGSALVVMQLEVPVATVLHAARQAAQSGARVVLNPAPAAELPDELYPLTDYLVPNETEAEALTGIKVDDPASAAAAARVLHNRGVPVVLVTLGARGVYISGPQGGRHLPAREVVATDTTAAGDCFIGGLVAGLCENMTVEHAAELGIAAASLCVARAGAQPALPHRAELRLGASLA